MKYKPSLISWDLLYPPTSTTTQVARPTTKSRFSQTQKFPQYFSSTKNYSHLTVNFQEKQSKDETNLSTAADLNTSPTLEDLTDSKVHFPYVENTCNAQYICPPPLLPAHVCLNSECLCPQVASMLHGNNMQVMDQHKSVYLRPKVEEFCGIIIICFCY